MRKWLKVRNNVHSEQSGFYHTVRFTWRTLQGSFSTYSSALHWARTKGQLRLTYAQREVLSASYRTPCRSVSRWWTTHNVFEVLCTDINLMLPFQWTHAISVDDGYFPTSNVSSACACGNLTRNRSLDRFCDIPQPLSSITAKRSFAIYGSQSLTIISLASRCYINFWTMNVGQLSPSASIPNFRR